MHVTLTSLQVEPFFISTNQTTNTTFSDLGLRLVVADVTQVTPDFRLTLLDDLDIHGDENYVPIEFAGTIATVFFSVSKIAYQVWMSMCEYVFPQIPSLSHTQWLYLMVAPFFTPRKEYEYD